MNIFVLDNDAETAASYMCDKHVVKMIVETAQMLSTAHRYLDGAEYIDKTTTGRKIKRYLHPVPNMEHSLCKAVMINHPCTKWTMETDSNYYWLLRHGFELLRQYSLRYGNKEHSMDDLYFDFLISPPKNIRTGSRTAFAQAMPDQYKSADAVEAYRNYYIGEKARFAQWKNKNIPAWYSEGLTSKLCMI